MEIAVWVVSAAIQTVCRECLELSTVSRESLDGAVWIVFPAIQAVLRECLELSMNIWGVSGTSCLDSIPSYPDIPRRMSRASTDIWGVSGTSCLDSIPNYPDSPRRLARASTDIWGVSGRSCLDSSVDIRTFCRDCLELLHAREAYALKMAHKCMSWLPVWILISSADWCGMQVLPPCTTPTTTCLPCATTPRSMRPAHACTMHRSSTRLRERQEELKRLA